MAKAVCLIDPEISMGYGTSTLRKINLHNASLTCYFPMELTSRLTLGTYKHIYLCFFSPVGYGDEARLTILCGLVVVLSDKLIVVITLVPQPLT